MALQLQTFTSLVRQGAAAVQGATTQLIDLGVGSVIRAILEANASVALWLQWLIVQLLALTRAATSNGAALDTWMADFTQTRLPASPATGIVTFSRYTPTLAATVPAGASVKTGDLTQSFTVNVATVIPAGTASANVAVTAATAGTTGNVAAGTVTVLGTAIPGVDYVNNAAAFANGLNAESDPALRARFVAFLASLAKGTVGAIEYAVLSIQQGLDVVVQENVNTVGTYTPGMFVVTVDDGSGNPPSSLLTTASAAVNGVRPVGSTYAVQGPVLATANVSLTIAVAAGAVKSAIQPLVSAALVTYIDALPEGAPLPYSRLAQVAYGASSSVTNVTAVTLNSGTADLVVAANGAIKAGTVAVN